jgi:inosose dehydratase
VERSKSTRSPAPRKRLGERLAGAPISWGVCEVPGWGFQLPPERVLEELAGLGFAAVERGPDGFLPDDPRDLRVLLARHRLRLVASFVPAVLHRPDRLAPEMEAVTRAARALSAAGGEVLVLAAATGEAGYERGRSLSEPEWRALARAVAAAQRIASAHDLALAVHPHYGTVIEDDAQVARLLEVSDAALCLDVGHLAVAGADALETARRTHARVRHVHLKDVEATLAARVRAGEMGYHAAVKAGLYRPLGQGASRIAEVVELLESNGYGGWYVLEHDVVLGGEPRPGEGPWRDGQRSLDFLRSLAA